MFRHVVSKAATNIEYGVKRSSYRRPLSATFFHEGTGTRTDSFYLQTQQQTLLSLRCFSTVQKSTKPPSRKPSKSSNPTATAITFLEKVHNQRFPQDLICQKVQDILLKMLRGKLRPSDGPIALDMLNVAVANADLPHELILPRLFSLSTQVMIASGHPLSFNEIIHQLHRLLDNHQKYFSNSLAYNSHHVNGACANYIQAVITDSKRSKQTLSPERRQHCQNLMTRLERLYEDPSIPLVANDYACNAFINLLCMQEKPHQAYDYLKWMVDMAPNHPVEIIPKVSTFSAVISAFAKSQPDISLEILQWMMRLHQMSHNENNASSGNNKNKIIFPAPNTICFNALLDAWARSGRRDAGQKAEQTLEWMQQLCDSEGLDTAPDEISFNSCIYAWANSPLPNAAVHAEAVLRKMIAKYQQGSNVAPTHVSFGSTMNAWANSGLPQAPDKIINLLNVMKTIEKQGFNTAQGASYGYAALLKAWEVIGKNHTKTTRSEKYISEILNVLHRMDQEGIEKSATIYNSAIMAIASFSPLSALLYFLQVETEYRKGKASIDVRTFNSALSCMAILNKQDVAERSKDVVDRMWEYSKSDPTVRPDQTTSNIILKILSRSSSPDSARLADTMLLEMGRPQSNVDISPAYVTVIIAWGRSNDPEKFERVQNLLERFQKAIQQGTHSKSSSPVVYNSALSVCQHNVITEWNSKAVDTMWFALEQLRQSKYAKPDQNTYVTLFQAINLLLKDSAERHTASEKEFANCIKDGLVCQPILEALYGSCPNLFEQLFGHGKTPASVEIPHTWSKRLRNKN